MTNRLSESTSLYLQQHAANPVDWHPWDEKALALARDSGKPILLSIGYSACHWCHVMAHESFEDEATAAVMNELFVNIKVDREERPDLDKLYQLSHQLLTRRGGGWPLTVFIDPVDHAAFFAGTYFPPQPRHGMPAFTDLLRKIRQWFDENPGAVEEQNRRLIEAVTDLQTGHTAVRDPDESIFEPAFEQLRQHFDNTHGGFGGGPKFPQAPQLSLLQAFSEMQQPFSGEAGNMLHRTLEKMALGGLRDHLDGGFFRYTVDGTWTIPHFEKMLYDNAMLLPLYAETAQRTGNALFRESAEGIVAWLLTEMQAENGGFFASMDADADGVEGGYHVWDRPELESLLDGPEFRAIEEHFGLDRPPNFEGRHWHLLRNSAEPGGDVLNAAKEKMRQHRSKRVAPATDTKLLTAWNALLIDGLARAGLALERDDWIDHAERALDFIRHTLWQDGTLYAVHAGKRTRFPAYLDDHAFLLAAVMSCLRARGRSRNIAFARQLANALLGRFADGEHGGFWFSAADQPVPVARLRPLQDDATPSGNGIAARALEELGHLLGETKYLDAARNTLRGSISEQQQHPLAHASLLAASIRHIHAPPQVVITGNDPDEIAGWKALATGHDRVNCYALLPEQGSSPGIPGLFEATEQTTAYVCEKLRCLPPATSKQAMMDQLKSLE